MSAVPVRLPGRVLHLCRSTGRGYRTACGRTLEGPQLELPKRRDWARCWRLELVCTPCSAKAAKARTERELAALAGWW